MLTAWNCKPALKNKWLRDLKSNILLSKIHHKIVSIKKTTLIPKSWYSFNEKSICKDTDLMLSLKQRKKLYRESASLRFISNFKNIRKPGTYQCSDERWKICQNDTNKFAMSNDQIWEIHEETDCHSVNVIYYGNCKICNEK